MWGQKCEIAWGHHQHWGGVAAAADILPQPFYPPPFPSPFLRAGGNKYSGGMAAAADILRNDGPKGFFKGWVANFARLGPQTVITFIVCERLRDVLGMKSF